MFKLLVLLKKAVLFPSSPPCLPLLPSHPPTHAVLGMLCSTSASAVTQLNRLENWSDWRIKHFLFKSVFFFFSAWISSLWSSPHAGLCWEQSRALALTMPELPVLLGTAHPCQPCTGLCSSPSRAWWWPYKGFWVKGAALCSRRRDTESWNHRIV